MMLTNKILRVPLLLCLVAGKEFQPYADNGGTLIGIAGRDYSLLAADTRLSDSYFIRSRAIRRIHVLDQLARSASEKPNDIVDDDGNESQNQQYEKFGSLLFGAAGCWADALGLLQGVREDITRYLWENDRPLSIKGLSHLLSTTLYGRRTFPYYSLCVIAGLDDESHQGSVYRFDSVGSFERVCATCTGKGEQLIQPMLDEATESDRSDDSALWIIDAQGDTFTSKNPASRTNLSIDDACKLVVKAFQAAAEREITIGDGVEIVISTRDGIRRLKHKLPK